MRGSSHLRYVASALGGTALAFAAACGNDDDGGQPDAEASGDAGPTVDAADIGPPEMDDREGRAYVTEILEITNPGGEDFSGADVDIEVTDPETNEGDTAFENENCTVTTFEPGQEPTLVDERNIYIDNTLVGREGAFGCGLDEAAGQFGCLMLTPAGEVTMNAEGFEVDNVDVIDVEVENANFEDYVFGSGFALLSGFDNDFLNQAPFPILSNDDTTVTLLDPLGILSGDSAEADAGSYTFVIGEGPFPGNQQPLFEGDPDGEARVIVGKFPSFNMNDFLVEAYPLGAELELRGGDEDGEPFLQPHEFLVDHADDTDVHFSCEEHEGQGQCVRGDANFDLEDLPGDTALIVSGATTDADLVGARDFELPPAETEYARFECTFRDEQTATIPEDAIGAILDTDPSRVETRVTFANGAEVANEEEPFNRIDVFVGHSLVGYSDLPAD